MSDPGKEKVPEQIESALVQAMQDGSKITLGPGVEKLMEGFAGMESLNKKSSDDVQDMKEMMSKSVDELAASSFSGQKDGSALQVIEIRGRKLMIPVVQQQRRLNAITIASLYALFNPDVDAVLMKTKVHGRFMLKDGTVVEEPFVPDTIDNAGMFGGPVVVPDPDAKPKGSKGQDYKPGKAILLDADPGELSLEPKAAVVIMDEDGNPSLLGTVVSASGSGYKIKDMYGNTTEIPQSRLKPIESAAEAAEWATKILSGKKD